MASDGRDRWASPPAEYSQRLVLRGTIEQAQTACYEAARDLGLGLPKTHSYYPLLFRDRCHPLSWPVQIEAYIWGDEGQVEVSFHGSSWAGRSARQREYVAKLVRALAAGVEREMGLRAASSNVRRWKRVRRVVLRCLTVAAMTPLVLAFPLLVVPSILWTGEPSKLPPFFGAFFCVFLFLTPLAEVVRRRLSGTGSHYDRIYAAVSLTVLFALVAGLITVKALGGD